MDAASGRELWRFEDEPEYPQSGNGGALILDIDGDGRLEVIDSAVAYVAAIDLDTGKLKWRYDDHIQVCHGITAAYDVDGDGALELVLGGEYNDADGTSSMVALRNEGTLMWRSSGHPHDLGSTRTHIADIDGDRQVVDRRHAVLRLVVTFIRREFRFGAAGHVDGPFIDSRNPEFRKFGGDGEFLERTVESAVLSGSPGYRDPKCHPGSTATCLLPSINCTSGLAARNAGLT
jgi:hypothetical protein